MLKTQIHRDDPVFQAPVLLCPARLHSIGIHHQTQPTSTSLRCQAKVGFGLGHTHQTSQVRAPHA